MGGTVKGGKLAAKTNVEKYGADFYRRLGEKGSKVKSPKKGFGGNRALARRAGAIGGVISRRTK